MLAARCPSASSPAVPAGAGIPDSGLRRARSRSASTPRRCATKLRSFARVQLIGELVNLRPSRARVYFELRDATGAIPCSAWRDGLGGDGRTRGRTPERGHAGRGRGRLRLLPRQRHLLARLLLRGPDLRVAGEGDLLARIERLRRQLDAEGLLERQKHLALPLLPRTIGVITGESGKARDDVLAALARRGWAGTAGVGLHARPGPPRRAGDRAGRSAISRRSAEVEVVIVARGGGSLADLLCFCDETLCRTVAMLGVPVIASVGHHTDRTLLDDVAAVSCSTPTHAAEAAVGVDCGARAARADGRAAAARLRDHGRRAVLSRAAHPAMLSRAPAAQLERQRGRCTSSCARLRAGAAAAAGQRAGASPDRRALVLERKSASALLDCRQRRPRELERLALALAGHDPQRTLERGYALAISRRGAARRRRGRTRGTAAAPALRRRRARREVRER